MPPENDRLVGYVSSIRIGSETFVFHRIHVHRNALYSFRRSRKYAPPPLVFYERQEVLFTIDFELQFESPLDKNLSHGFARI
jgi:hypothetical protein